MKSERGNLNMIQLLMRAGRQTRVISNWETNFRPACHSKYDPSVHVRDGT